MPQYTKDNLDLNDKYKMKDVWEHNGVVFCGDTKMVNDEEPPYKIESVSPMLAAAVLGLNNTASPTKNTSQSHIMWTDYDAQEIFLRAPPTNYLILGKPSLGSYSLGESLSQKYKCIHLCPRNIITEEISQASSTGNCLDFNMKHNLICRPSTLLKMLKQKIKSPAIKHRGYVISGFPFVNSYRNLDYLIKTEHTEEALLCVDKILFDIIYNLKRKKPKSIKSPGTGSTRSSMNLEREEAEVEETEEEVTEEAEEEVVAAELPTFILNSCAAIFNKARKARIETQQALLLRQLENIFNLSIKPDVMIYITCPDSDVVVSKYNKYINYKTGLSTVEPFLDKGFEDLRWPTLYNVTDYENLNNYHTFTKYYCRPPTNFNKKAMDQICNYKRYVSPYIEKKVMDYDPKYVIKLDGRISTHKMMHEITERLLLMDIKPVIIPEPLYIEEPPEDYDEFWKMVEETRVIHSGILKFECFPSPWFNRCPVELKKRQSVYGKPKFAVKLFKHVYLMYSLDNFISFCMNPRPYLKLEYLEPTCRIIVTGTRSSGKSMVAECLSWIFDTPVTSYVKEYETIKHDKYDGYVKTILSEIIATIEDARLEDYKMQEENRIASLHEWCKSIILSIKQYIPLLTQFFDYISEKMAQKEIPLEPETEDAPKIKKPEPVPPKPVTLNKILSLRLRLSFLPVSLEIVEDCETMLSNLIIDHSILLQYAPHQLLKETALPKLPVIGDKDVMSAIDHYIVVNDLQKEIDPSTEEMMTAITSVVSTMVRKRRHEMHLEIYGKYIIDGFPSDSEFWEILSKSKLLPDYTIAIIENREVEPELLVQYLDIEKSAKNHQEVLLSLTDPLVLSKLQTKKLPTEQITQRYMEILSQQLVYHSVNSMPDTDAIADNIDPSPEMLADFAQSIEKFREDWDSIKIKLEETTKCFVEIELENKSHIEVAEEMLLKLRQCYFWKGEVIENDEAEEEEDISKDLLTYNSPKNLCESNIYCPYTYFNHDIFWEGKHEFSLKYNNKIHYFAKEEYVELYQKDITSAQAYNKPFKQLPKLRICLTGCTGSGKSTMSKKIATELGLLHIDFQTVINNYIPKHYKKVGRIYENPFTDKPTEEEANVEFKLDEENPNLFAEILSNEVELRRILFNYFELGQPFIPAFIQKIITRIWFDYPYKNIGFILDGYPRLSQDIEDMIQCSCIPDLIIDLNSDAETAVERLGHLMLQHWKLQLKEAKEAHRIKFQDEKNEWMQLVTKNVVAAVIIEEILESLPKEEQPEQTPELDNLSAASVVIPVGSEKFNSKLFIAYNNIVEQYPEPIDDREWEKPEDQREKIDSRTEVIYETEFENIESMKEIAEENKIKIFSVDGTKPFYKVQRRILSRLSNLRFRPSSVLEQTFIIPNDIAELLLSQGYYFLSKFGRTCPVYISKNRNTIFNSYKISQSKGKLFPVIHRAYIYFISSERNVMKFRKHPLNYIVCNAIETFYPYPLRIAITGTPKSGKSSLAAKLAKQYNLLCLSKGMALREVLSKMHWTELGCKMVKTLEAGDVLDNDLVMSAVQTVAMDQRTVTYGFVLDGFPSSPSEAMALARDGLYPNIIFGISSDKPVVLTSSQSEVYYDLLKYKPPYSLPFIEDRFNKWNEQCYKLRNWVNIDYQNMRSLNGNESKWQCLQDAKANINELIDKIHYYLANVETNIVPAHAMAISNEIYEQKQSSFKNMCPICLAQNDLRHYNYAGDKKGIVQYKDKLYWICADHMGLVLTYPDIYLTKQINIPELPAVVKIIHVDNVHENGICIVTYAEGLPRQILETGTNKFAASYRSKTYMFCTEACLHKFLDKPHLYWDVTVFKGTSWFPRLSLKNLPILGFLEQTLGSILTEACCALNAVRPKYPGLTFQLSGLIYIALFLKTHNPLLPQEKVDYFSRALKIFECRSQLILDLGLRMRCMDNPFASYPEVRPATPKSYSQLGSVVGELSMERLKPFYFNSSDDVDTAVNFPQ